MRFCETFDSIYVFSHIACGFQMAAVLLYTFDELMVVSCTFGSNKTI